MDTGFNYYHGADPGEYDLVVSNSEGGLDRLRELGARRAEAVFWGADPELFQPLPVDKQMDVLFYGYGDKFRRDWMEAMVGEPSRRLEHVDFVLGGRDFQGDTGLARELGDVPFNVFGRAISEARVYQGIERWFEPGRELLVVQRAEQAVDAYRELLDDPGRAEELGRAARERSLDEHTYVHRARRLLELVGLRSVAAVATGG